MINSFAATEVPLAAEPIFNIGPLVVTNSMFFGAIIAIAVLTVFIVAAKKSKLKPKSRFAFAMESLVDMILTAITDNFGGDRSRAIKHVPLMVTLFTFILVSNLTGLLPGVGTITVDSGEHVSPLLRPFTSDLNGTIALAILTIGLVQFHALRELGIIGHLKNYFTNKPWNPMNLFIGAIEVMGEFIRVITLSLRLFGVIYAGEVLMHVIGDLAGSFGWAANVPVYFLEVFFSAIQAYIFIMLASSYIGMATTSHHDDEEESKPDHSTPRLKIATASDNN